MSLFNKINKGIDKTKKKEVDERMELLFNSVAKSLQDNKATFYEVMDILSNLQMDLNLKIAEILRSNHAKIKEQEEKLIRYDLNKPEKDTEQKAGQ